MQDILAESDARMLTELLGDVRDGILITDEVGRIRYVNGAAIHILGLTGNIRGRFFDDVCAIYDFDTNEKIDSPIKQALEEKISVGLRINSGIRWPDGSFTYLSATSTPIVGKDGKVRGTSSLFRDITRLRRLELKLEENQQYLRTIFSAVAVGLLIVDSSCNVVDLNRSAEQILETAAHSAIGRRFGDIFKCQNSIEAGCGNGKYCQKCPMNYHLLQAAASTGSYNDRFDVALHRVDDNRVIWLRVDIATVAANDDKHIIVSLIDISERKIYEYELEQAKAVAEAANTAKGQFLANMSHELRTPITGMVGMIDHTLRTKLTDYQRDNLNSAKECSEYLLNIINDILDFSKLESGSLKLENLRFDLMKNLHQVLSSHTKAAMEKGLYIKAQFADNLPRYISGDALRIRQILHNLISNAIKFTNSGGVTVKVVRGERLGSPTLEFSIRDTGIGMVKADLSKLFKPFSQVDGSSTRRFGGTGLGLRITKELVDLMSGGVGVSSKAGEGSIFSFWIPCHEVNEADDVVRYRSVYVNPTPRRNTNDTDDDIADLMKYCMDELSK
ncbi:MAG: ATP-binding protein [Selenomonadaceae bacterium]|nr:ATP-binding protein [Selenomonadaceae bacterium]